MNRYIVSWLGVLFFAVGCASKPDPIDFGKDVCDYCRMTIADPKFGAELITAKGRVYKYDAMECMINHINEDAPESKMLLGIAYDKPGKLFSVDSLSFIISEEYRSPMGANLACFKNAQPTKMDVLNWNKLNEKINSD